MDRVSHNTARQRHLRGDRLTSVDIPSLEERANWLDQLGSHKTHQRLLSELPCLRQVTQRGAETPALSGWVRVGAWNVLRGRRPEALAGTLASSGVQLGLLSELDDGMARTHNVDTTDAIAGALRFASAFGVEFVELGLGDESEQEEAAGQSNGRGLHGNAIVSASSLEEPVVLRLPDVGAGWFAADSSQPRVGGRMAVVGTVAIDGVPVHVASTHLENRTAADHRAEQLEVLLSAIDARDASGPALVGGDFNTLGADIDVLLDRAAVRALREDEPWRFTWPVVYEPLFEVARAHGFVWTDANVAAPTMDHAWAGLPDLVPMRLDWLLVRGLVARRPSVVPADGLSDHHLITAGVHLP
jgi:endonuclease/exonuclease/phosphatase family metal-dependent hydrolase